MPTPGPDTQDMFTARPSVQQPGIHEEDTMILVRHAKDSDKPHVSEVTWSAVKTLRQTYRPTAEAIRNRSKLARRLKRLVAVLDNRAVGTVQYKVRRDTLFIIGLGVHENSRRKGVAAALLAHLAGMGRQNNLKRLSLHTIKETGNVPVFEKLGFRAVSEETARSSESDWFTCLTDVKMERQI